MSTGFTFGAKSPAPSFGQPGFGAQTSGSITFGTPTVPLNVTPFGSTAQPSTGFGSTAFGMSTFGTPSSTTQSTGLTFGAPVTSSTGFSFGATPASSTPSTGLTFGTPTSSAPIMNTTFGFGTSTPAFTGLTFGTPATSTATGFSFGNNPPAATGLSFSNNPPAATGLTFGNNPPAATGLTFGNNPPAATGLTFGNNLPTATSLAFGNNPPAATGLTFGNNPPTATGLTFGTPATTATPSLGFATSVSSSGLTFGCTPTTTSSGLFSSSFPFGTTTTTTASSLPALNFNFGAATTSTAPTFSLIPPTATTTTSTPGLNFGFGTTTQSGGLSFGLGGTTTALSFSKPVATATNQLTFGLGGVVQSTPKSEPFATGKQEILPRDQLLPNELFQTVENVKNRVKYNKNSSSYVARCSIKEYKKVASSIDQVGNVLNEVEKQLQNSRAITENLKIGTAKDLQHIEMAQRTMDTPAGLQHENIIPIIVFNELIDNFEKETQNLKTQIDHADKFVRNFTKPLPLNSQDLALGMRRLHETFVALAGRLQTVHSQVDSQKEQYLNFRKYMLHDDTNVFETPKQQSDVLNITLNSFYKSPATAFGPSPFSSLSHPSVIQAAVQNQTQSTVGNVGAVTLQQPLGNLATTTSSLFGNTPLSMNLRQSSSSQFNASSNTSFQLQKPPSGNKRGKQIT